MYSGGSGLSIDSHFVDIELSYDVLSPLPTLLSKHFNHPHPYIEIATAISDYVFHYEHNLNLPSQGKFHRNMSKMLIPGHCITLLDCIGQGECNCMWV